jgi:hypothetical protein
MTDDERRQAVYDLCDNAASLLAEASQLAEGLSAPYPPFFEASLTRVAADARALAEMLKRAAAPQE